MINLLDDLLRQLLKNGILRGGAPVLVADTQLRCQPPDEDWRALVQNNPDLALNVYLVDLRENRKLRTNERDRMVQGSDVFEVPPPRRVDCHYLISAWSPVQPSPALDPTPDEHWLLAETARVLGAHDELDPVAIYAMSNPPQLPPPVIAAERFPLTLLPPEGFPKYAEFWGTMGDKNRWKPCVHVVITVALREPAVKAGPPVTTVFTRALPTDFPVAAETRFHIGGTVLRAAGSTDPVPMAYVELLTPAGLRLNAVRADALGRFIFADVPAGNHQLRARLTVLPLPATPPPPANAVSPLNPITVPSPGGGYDIHF